MTFGIIKNVFRDYTNFVFNQQNNEVFYPSDCLEVQTGTMVNKHSFYTNKGSLAPVANLLVNLTIDVSQKIEEAHEKIIEAIKGLGKRFNDKIEKLEDAITKIHKKVRNLEESTSDATGKTLVTLTKRITDLEKGNLSLSNSIHYNSSNGLNTSNDKIILTVNKAVSKQNLVFAKEIKNSCDDISETKQTNFCYTQKEYKKTWQFFHEKILLIKVKKRNFDLQSKKNYRCWIRNKEGHYTNKCQSRKNYPEKVKLITEATSDGFKPIEDPYQGHLQVYTMKIVVQNSSDAGINTSSESF